MSIQSTDTLHRRMRPAFLLILWLPFLIPAQQRVGTEERPIVGTTFDSRTGIPIVTVTDAEMFPKYWLEPAVNARATNISKGDIERSLKTLHQEMSKYPESYLRQNIKRIYLLGSLALYGIPCDGTVSSDSLYLVNGGGKEYSDEYIGLIFHQAYGNLTLDKSRRANGYETSSTVRCIPRRRALEMPSADRRMKKVYDDGPVHIYALEKTGFVGLTLLKQFRSSSPQTAIRCPIRCREVRQISSDSLREAINEHRFDFQWRITDSKPVWSHRGKQIAFHSTRDFVRELYVMDLDGTNIRRLTRTTYSPYQTTGFSPAVWSADDRQLAYVMHPGGPSKLFVVNADGTGKKHLSLDNRTNSGVFLIGWLPDRRILFLAEGYDRSRTLYSVLPDGTELTPLTQKQMVVRDALLSPNQALLAITTRDGTLLIKDLKTNALLESMHANVNVLSWSPDSKLIAVGSGGSLIIRDLESHKGAFAEQQEFQPGPRRVLEISWAPDGKQIAYVVGSAIVSSIERPTQLHAVNVNGKASRRLAANGFSPVWSPDGKYVAFSRQGRLYLVKADGTEERYVVDGAYSKWIP